MSSCRNTKHPSPSMHWSWTRQHSVKSGVPKASERVRGRPLFRLWGSHKSTKLNIRHIYAVTSVSPMQVLWLPFQSLWALWAQVSWFCEFSCVVLDLYGSYNPFCPSSAGVYKRHLMLACESASLSISCWWKPLKTIGLGTNWVTGNGRFRLVSTIARSLSWGCPCRFLGDPLIHLSFNIMIHRLSIYMLFNILPNSFWPGKLSLQRKKWSDWQVKGYQWLRKNCGSIESHSTAEIGYLVSWKPFANAILVKE